MLLYPGNKSRLYRVHAFYYLSVGMTIWSGTRAAILAIVLTAVFLILVRRRMPDFRALGIIATLTGAAATTAWLLLPYNDPAFMLFASSDTAGAEQMSGGRLALWAATIDRWQLSPLLGWGSGSQFWEVYVGWPHTQPHNAVLQFLISWGIVGAASALWLLGRAILKVHMIAGHNDAVQPILAILYTLLLMSLLEGMLHYPRFIMLIMVAFASIMAYNANSRKQAVNLVGVDK